MSIPFFKLLVSIGIGISEIPEQNFHSAIRGVFGRVLKDTFCIQKRLTCDVCPMQTCLYRQIFEPNPDGFENFKPYIIRHLGSQQGRIDVEFLFLGSLTKYCSSILHCILNMQDFPLLIQGVRHPIQILSVLDSQKNQIYLMNGENIAPPSVLSLKFIPKPMDSLRMVFLTPLRMKHEGKLMRHFSWPAFHRALYSRISYLDKIYNDSKLSLPEFWEDSPFVVADLSWQEMYRKSFRQNQAMSLGGLIGTVDIHQPKPDTVALLRMGSILQVGKQCTFGLGKYKIPKT